MSPKINLYLKYNSDIENCNKKDRVAKLCLKPTLSHKI